jgi:hypothetical protein
VELVNQARMAVIPARNSALMGRWRRMANAPSRGSRTE